MKLFLFLAVVLSTNVIQGITGFAGTVLAMPFSILLYGIDTAKPALTILTTLACIFVVATGYKDIAVKPFIRMFLLMFAGVFAGEFIYKLFQPEALLKFYAVFILVIAVSGLFKKTKIVLPERLLDIVALAAGIIHGMFISGGPLLIIYATQKLPEKQQFRVTLSLLWICLDCYLMVRQYMSGLMTHETLSLTAMAIPALCLGVFIGGKLSKKMSQKFFLKLTYVLLIISGLSLFL